MEETSKARCEERTQSFMPSQNAPLSSQFQMQVLSKPHPFKILWRWCYLGMIDLIISYLWLNSASSPSSLPGVDGGQGTDKV